jgi:GT2 family glycosyltransferase
MDNPAQIDIVIVNWNAGDLLKRCMQSILSSEKHELIGSIVIVDNASTDESLEDLSSDNRITVISNAENKGFAFACNQGITYTNNNFVVMLNPDVELNTNTLFRSLEYMELHPATDIMGCMQLDENGNITPCCARFPRPTRYLGDALGLTKAFPSLFKSATLKIDSDHRSSKFVDQIMGSYMFIRRKVFEKVGVFDTRFFVYYEELDLSKRLASVGGKSFYNHTIQLTHTGKGTTEKIKAFRLFLSLDSRLMYSKKHFSITGHAFTFFITLFIEPVTRVIFSLVKVGNADAANTFKGYRMIWSKWLGGRKI